MADTRTPAEKPRRRYKGLGVGGFCIPEPALSDKVTHRELQDELNRIREAVITMVVRSHDLGVEDRKHIASLLERPEDRKAGRHG